MPSPSSMSSTPPIPAPEDVRRAHAVIAPWIRRTPLLSADRASVDTKAHVSFKLELFQHGGSFKSRGALHSLLTSAIPPVGVTAASGGNHGVAVALAARRLGHRARIFVPAISSAVKVAAIEAHGAQIEIGGARYADAQAACDLYAKESGALLIHPYDAAATVAGAGTVALEWEEDLARACDHALRALDTVLVAVGGGGLLAGVAAYFAGRVKVVGVEPEGSCCLHAALEAGAPVDVTVESLAADSLGAKRVGALPFAIARAYAVRSVRVSDDAIRTAQRTLFRDYRIATEPGGAAALAALLEKRYVPTDGERVGVLLCGGNVDITTLA